MTRNRPNIPAVLVFVATCLLALWLIEVRAQQIAGEIVYTDDDDYPALCAGRELDAHGRPVVARISVSGGLIRITATSCTRLFGSGFEQGDGQ